MHWYLLAIVVGLICIYFAWKMFKQKPATHEETINVSNPEPETPKPVPTPEDIQPAPSATIDPIADRREVIQEVIAEPAPLAEKTFLEEPMVQPVESPISEPEKATEVEAETSFPAFGTNASAQSEPVVEKKTVPPFTGKFSDDEVRAIRESTDSNEILAVKYDSSVTTIKRIKRRETYKHVE